MDKENILNDIHSVNEKQLFVGNYSKCPDIFSTFEFEINFLRAKTLIGHLAKH